MTKIHIHKDNRDIKGQVNGLYFEFSPDQTAEVDVAVLSALRGANIKLTVLEEAVAPPAPEPEAPTAPEAPAPEAALAEEPAPEKEEAPAPEPDAAPEASK